MYTKELFHNMPTLVESNYPDMPEIEITLDGVVSLLQKLKPFKACGPDQISNRILKEVAEEIACLREDWYSNYSAGAISSATSFKIRFGI